MATHAGEMEQTPPGNPQWRACDNKPYYVLDAAATPRTPIPGTPSRGNRQDYCRRVGWQGRRRGLGPLGWIIEVPYDPAGTWYISLADDNSETALTPPVPWPGKPPPGVK